MGNYHMKVIQDRVAQLKSMNESDLNSGIKMGAELRIKAKEAKDDLRRRKIAATTGMNKSPKKTIKFSAGEQFDAAIHRVVDGDPVLNKDGSYAKKKGKRPSA